MREKYENVWLAFANAQSGALFLFEKHWNVHTVTVSTVTFHVHTVTLVCNGLDIFKFICSNMYFLEDLYCSFCFQLIV